MRVEECALKVIGLVWMVVSFVLIAPPAYAGYGTITETDTEIYVEYYGDEKDIQAGKLVREEVRKDEEAAAKANAELIARKQAAAARNEAKMKRREEE